MIGALIINGCNDGRDERNLWLYAQTTKPLTVAELLSLLSLTSESFNSPAFAHVFALTVIMYLMEGAWVEMPLTAHA